MHLLLCGLERRLWAKIARPSGYGTIISAWNHIERLRHSFSGRSCYGAAAHFDFLHSSVIRDFLERPQHRAAVIVVENVDQRPFYGLHIDAVFPQPV